MEHGREPIRILHFAADLWEHVCPVLRVTGPVEMSGLTLIKGNQWQDGELVPNPDLIPDADIVIIQRDFPRYAQVYETILDKARSAGKLVIYELDDLLTELPTIHPGVQHYMGVRASVLGAIIEADAVTCSTPALSNYIKTFNPNVAVIPNYLNDSLWTLRDLSQPQEKTPDEPVVIGYLGAHSHAPDLVMVTPVLEELLDQYGDRLWLRLWGIQPPPNLRERPNVEWLDPGLVSYSEFAAYFSQQASDIFIAPLLDNLFNRCKSSLKFLEYGCLGVPGVFSDLPTYSSVVRHGKNGFLATTASDWQDLLKQLIEDENLRRRIGKAAQTTLRKYWLLSDHLDRWITTYKILTGKPKSVYSGERLSNIVRKYINWGDQERDLRLQEVNGLERQVRSFSNEISLLETKIKASEAEAASLKSELAQRVEEILALKDQTSALDSELEKSNAQVGQMRDEIKLYEEVIDKLQAVVAEREARIHQLDEHVYAITHSAGWRLLEALYRIRLFIAPRGSFRERLLIFSKRLLSVLRSQGFVILARRVISTIFSKNIISARVVLEQCDPYVIEIVATDEGIPVRTPSISVILECKESSLDISEQEVLKWIEKQTIYSAIEVVKWDRMKGVIYPLNSPEKSIPAPDFMTLCGCLDGKYLCIVTSELLQQMEVFLEINLIALESESLVFTLNLHSLDDIALQEINANRLPGSCDLPFLRLVVRKEYVRNDCSLDLSKWLADRHGKPGVVGRIIPNGLYVPESEKAIPHETRISGVRTETYGYLILAHNHPGVTSDTIAHYVKPVKDVMPIINMINDFPTVLVVAPFLAVGGAERVALDVLRGLQDKIRFVVVTLDPCETALGTTILLFRQITPYVYETPEYLDRTQNLSHLEYLIRQYKPISLYIVNGSSWIYDQVEILRKRYPDLRITNQVYDHQAGWINRYDDKLAANIDVNIGCNERICQAYSAHGVASERIYLIENGVNLEEFDPALYSSERCIELKEKLGLPLDKKIVTFLSRIHPQKRPMDFIELARRFRHDDGLVFIMVGDGPLANTVDEVSSSIGLSNFYRFPFYSPSSDIYAITDVMVLTSEYEGMPMVILEAQAMGKPVLVTDVGNNKDLLEVSGGGYVVPKIGDINGLRFYLKKALKESFDPQVIRGAISEHYSLQGMIEKYRKALLGE